MTALAITSQHQLIHQLHELGVQSGGVLLVHTAFSKVRPVEGGPAGLITALQASLGAQGTLVMPSMSGDDEHVFDPQRTPTENMGIGAETFWRLPQVLRSDSPHAFAASGRLAALITAPHPPDVPHGLDSPVGRVHELGGQVLLLGVCHDANTTIHLAENLAGVRYRIWKYLTVLKDGQPTRLDYGEIDHCCQNFNLLDDWLDEKGLQRKGTVGHAEARLICSRDIVSVALGYLKADETIFLHPPGIDDECDTARASLM